MRLWLARSTSTTTGVVLCGLFGVLSLVNIRKPGLHYDEVFWANAALGNTEGPFVVARFLRIPTYLQAYTGALKAWVYFPVFKLFGTSTFSVRIPMIILGIVGLWLLFRFVSTLFDRRTAVMALLLMILNTSFLFHVRMDFGPVVFEFLFKVLALTYAFQMVKRPTTGAVVRLYAILLLGLFNKLNFIWFINALTTGVALFFWSEIRNQLGTLRHRLVGYYCAGYLICLAYYLTINRFFDVQSFFSLSAMGENLRLLPGRLRGTVSGLSFYEHFAAMPLRWSEIYVGGLLAVTVLGVLFVVGSAEHNREQRYMAFFGYVVVALLVQIVATQQAGASWHYLMLYPMLAVVSGYAMSVVYSRLRLPLPRAAYFGAGLAFLVAFQGNVYLAYQRHFDVPDNPMWSPRIAELAAYTRSSSSDFVVIDWGIWNQLVLADDDPGKYTSLEFFLQAPLGQVHTDYFVREFVEKPGLLFVTHPSSIAAFPTSVARFFAIVADRNLTLQKVKAIADERQVLFEVYQVQR